MSKTSFGGGTNNFEKTVIQKLKESFVTSPEELQSFKYLGQNKVKKMNVFILRPEIIHCDELKEVAIDTKRKMSKEAQLAKDEA